MAAIRKKGGKALPPVSTASLPDIVFMLLFFFMVATVMRETELKVQVRYPQATELQKLEKKSLVSYIYIGSPTGNYREQYGTAPIIQLNDEFVNREEYKSAIAVFIQNERAKVDEKLIPQMTTSLRVDKEVKMGIITDVKQELRKVNSLKINYSATQRTADL